MHAGDHAVCPLTSGARSLFVNIVAPHDISPTSNYPVKVYIQGGHAPLRLMNPLYAADTFVLGSCSSARHMG